MIRFLLMAAIFYLVIQLFRFFHNLKRYSQNDSSKRSLPGLMVKDKVCGLYLPEEEALKEKIDGQIYYFCSQECKQRFLKERKNKSFNQTSV